MLQRFFAVSVLLLLSLPAHAQTELISLRLWCELEPMVQENEEYPLSTAAAQARALEEARGILSGMIYGFRFSYTPGDSVRKIGEQFTITPVAEVLWGDPNLRIADAYIKESLLFVKVSYELEDFQFARRRAWASNSVEASSGVGSYSVFTAPGPEGKRQALQEALKNAVREALRPVHYNKPREVTGEIIIWSEPQTVIRSGTYTTQLDVKLRVKEIRSYSLF
ncbi:MAG: hypothetical protein JSV89_22165 [Spirochaetaceae bacterium]|nr:MAG: hypothetical protein JSV89_22165 [Spirochaetaceae bacterium]